MTAAAPGFSDEKLAKLQTGLEKSDDWEAFNFNCELMPRDIEALLARLEAAERVCYRVDHWEKAGVAKCSELTKWRKACRKGDIS